MKARHVQAAPAGATLEGVPRCQRQGGFLGGLGLLGPFQFLDLSGCLACFASQDPWQPRQGNRDRWCHGSPLTNFEAKHGRHQVERSQPQKKRRQASRNQKQLQIQGNSVIKAHQFDIRSLTDANFYLMIVNCT